MKGNTLPYLHVEIENLEQYLATRQDEEILPTGDTHMANAMYALINEVRTDYPTTVEQLRKLIRKVSERAQELDHLNGAVGAVYERLEILQRNNPSIPATPSLSEKELEQRRLQAERFSRLLNPDL
jgi:hypothetical protein